MSSATSNALIVEPPSELQFKGPCNEIVTSYLHITNTSNERVCFKVKTTAPRQYCVRPNAALLESQQSLTVKVLLQPHDRDFDTSNHKFMVQYTSPPPGEVKLSEVWRSVRREDLFDFKLRVCVIEENSDENYTIDKSSDDDIPCDMLVSALEDLPPTNTGITHTPSAKQKALSSAQADKSKQDLIHFDDNFFDDNFVTMKMHTIMDEDKDLPKQNDKRATVGINDLQHQLIEEQSKKFDLMNKKIQNLEHLLSEQNKPRKMAENNLQQPLAEEQNRKLDIVSEKIQNLEQNIQQQMQMFKSKLEEEHQAFQCNILEHKNSQTELERQLQQECNDKIKHLQEQLQQHWKTSFESLENQLGRINSLMTSVSTKVDTLSPSWVVYRHEVKIDAKQEIGRGAYGTVNIATFRGTKVAAKSLHKAISSPYYLSTFAREMDMAGRCRHPNLLQFIGATKEGDFIILTEIMDTSLRAAMGKKLIKDDHVVSICLDVAQGLNYLHESNPAILHRDVSSANVLLNELPHNKWLAKLSDYGTANFILNTGTQNPGAAIYCAPESADPDNQTPKMDVYSYGKLVFEICVNELPTIEIFRANFPRAKTMWSPLKCKLIPLIDNCLKRNKEERPHMKDIIESLQKL